MTENVGRKGKWRKTNVWQETLTKGNHFEDQARRGQDH